MRAIHESDPQNPDALYPPHTVEMILLAFVYKKYSGDRNVLKAFFDELNLQLGRKILLDDLDEQWIKESFKAVNQAEALNKIEHIFAAQDLMQSIKQHFAEFVYNAFQIRAFPAPIGYATSSYAYEIRKTTAGFSDCMCNTMRNFINLYAYDVEKNQFTLEKLLANMDISAAHPALAYFLKSFGDINITPSQQAHNAWLTVISDIPYGAYNRVVDGATGQSSVMFAGKGYIAIPENERTEELPGWLKNNGYQPLGKNQYGYELQPSIKNIIIVLDHLLQLNLFMQAGGLAKEFMRPDFIAIYFSKLCATLKATGFLSTQSNAERGEFDKDFDALDYTQNKLYMYFDLAKIIGKFTTSSGHGELELIKAEGSLEEWAFINLLQKIQNFTDQLSLSLLVTNVLYKQEINFENLKNNPHYLYINLFATPLENTGRLHSILNGAFFSYTHLKTKISIKDLLLRLADNQPDATQRQNLKLSILNAFVHKLSNDEAMRIGSNILKELVQAATQGIEDQNHKIRLLALSLFRALVEKGQSYPEAIQAATKEIMDQSQSSERMYALHLFKVLFKKDQGFAEAIQAATKGIVNQEEGVRHSAIDLFEALFDKGQAFPEAIEVATKGIVNQKPEVRESALNLFKALFDKDQAFYEATQVAEKGIADPDDDVRYSALELFQALVAKDQAFDKAAQAAEKGITDDFDVMYLALDLFKQLITKVPDETKKIIQKLLDDPNLTWDKHVKDQLGELLKK